ncbi:MAG: HNH endonuclease [Methanophagales archaeon]|nr:HNH endonuclease [Methanophagales archaeon]
MYRLVKGGKTEESNAQLAHKKCNQQKRDRIKRMAEKRG